MYPQFTDLNEHHAFIVRYKVGEDVDLAKHIDRSDVTLNVCLGTSWTGNCVIPLPCSFNETKTGGGLRFHEVQATEPPPTQVFEYSHRKT